MILIYQAHMTDFQPENLPQSSGEAQQQKQAVVLRVDPNEVTQKYFTAEKTVSSSVDVHLPKVSVEIGQGRRIDIPLAMHTDNVQAVIEFFREHPEYADVYLQGRAIPDEATLRAIEESKVYNFYLQSRVQRTGINDEVAFLFGNQFVDPDKPPDFTSEQALEMGLREVDPEYNGEDTHETTYYKVGDLVEAFEEGTQINSFLPLFGGCNLIRLGIREGGTLTAEDLPRIQRELEEYIAERQKAGGIMLPMLRGLRGVIILSPNQKGNTGINWTQIFQNLNPNQPQTP